MASRSLTISNRRPMRGSSLSALMPMRSSSARMLDLPACSDTSTLRLLPTLSGADVFVSRRILGNRGSMDAGLGGEGAFADIRRVPVGAAVEPLVQRVRDVREFLQRGVADADVESVGVFRLQFQRRNDRHQVGVAAALAEPVERALDLARAGAHGGKGIGHRLLGIVVGVDADVVAGDRLAHRADDLLDFVRQRAAIGVAQHDPARAGVISCLGAG